MANATYIAVDPMPMEEPERRGPGDALGVLANNSANNEALSHRLVPIQPREPLPSHQEIPGAPLVAQTPGFSIHQTNKPAGDIEVGQQELYPPFLGESSRVGKEAQQEEEGTGRNRRHPLKKIGVLSRRCLPEKWRRLPLLWTILTWIILSVHIVLLYFLPPGPYGLGILATSAECSSLRSKKRSWGLFFNLMATAIFTASNSVMQLLVAPNRTNLDAAHAKKRPMDIGVPSIENLNYIGIRRVFIWVLLGVPGLTLHALYNGLFYVAASSRRAFEVVVSENFFDPNSSLDILDLQINEDSFLTKFGSIPPGIPARTTYGISELQLSLASLKQHHASPQWNKSDFFDCLDRSIFSASIVHPNIVLVLNWTDPLSNNTILGIEDLGEWDSSMPALCPLSFYQTVVSGFEVLEASTDDPPGFITFEAMASNPDVGFSCTKDLATGYEICSICPTSYEKIPSYDPEAVPFVMYCYNEVVNPAPCHLVYSHYILKIITIMMAIKAAGLTLAMLQLRKRPIIAVGDAIKEYLQSPDQHTVDCSLKGARIVKEAFPMTAQVPWSSRGWVRFKFFDNNAGQAWGLFALATAVTFSVVYEKVPSSGLNLILAHPSLESDMAWIIKPTMLVNCAQVLAAVRAYLDQGTLSRGRTNSEFQAFATVRSGLRVTGEPIGRQQNPYFIHRSIHSVIACQLLSALYAWMLASCLYGEIYTLDFIDKPPNLMIPSFNLMVIAGSAKGNALEAFIFILPLILCVTMCGIARFQLRRWGISIIPAATPYMPFPGFSSLAISVACHPREEEGDISSEEIQWGIVKQKSGETPGQLAFTKMPILNARAEDEFFGFLCILLHSSSDILNGPGVKR